MDTEGKSAHLKKASWSMFLVGFIIYSVISMTKSAYSASMASIINEGILKTSSAGIINTWFYIFYGGGQLRGFVMVDMVSLVSVIYMTLIGTLIAIIGMAFAKTFTVMLILWSFCGLMQFAVWPAMLRIIAEYVLMEHRQRAMILISFAYCIGMLTNYFIASIVLGVSNWRMLFVVSGVIIVACIISWAWIIKKTKTQRQIICQENKKLNEADLKTKENDAESHSMSFIKLLMVSGVIFLLVPAVFRSAMDLGLKTWVPKMMIDIYGVSESLASTLTTILVAVNLAGVFVAGLIHQRISRNTVLAFGICFMISIPFNVVLLFSGKIHILVVVLMLTLITTMMYAGHQLINVVIPSSFSRYNKTGSVAAMLNAIAAFGNAATTYGFGYIAENFGWNMIMVLILGFAVVSALFSVIAAPLWAKFSRNRVII